jgi:carbonic anhydrase
VSRTPGEIWKSMVQGNERFLSGQPAHPRQDVERRELLAEEQTPHAALFGCSDSRLSAEIIFDQGLGDLFVVRNAGQVISNSVLGSLEYAVHVLGVGLIVVLAHDHCGAVEAAISRKLNPQKRYPAHIETLIGDIAPAVERVQNSSGTTSTQAPDSTLVGTEHLRDTISVLLSQSELIGQSIAEGRLAIVGANYVLAEGRVSANVVIGEIDTPHHTV